MTSRFRTFSVTATLVILYCALIPFAPAILFG